MEFCSKPPPLSVRPVISGWLMPNLWLWELVCPYHLPLPLEILDLWINIDRWNDGKNSFDDLNSMTNSKEYHLWEDIYRPILMNLFFEIKVFEIKGVKYKMKKIKRESSVPNSFDDLNSMASSKEYHLWKDIYVDESIFWNKSFCKRCKI